MQNNKRSHSIINAHQKGSWSLIVRRLPSLGTFPEWYFHYSGPLPKPEFKCKLCRRSFTFLMTPWRPSCWVQEDADFIKNGSCLSCLRSWSLKNILRLHIFARQAEIYKSEGARRMLCCENKPLFMFSGMSPLKSIKFNKCQSSVMQI